MDKQGTLNKGKERDFAKHTGDEQRDGGDAGDGQDGGQSEQFGRIRGRRWFFAVIIPVVVIMIGRCGVHMSGDTTSVVEVTIIALPFFLRIQRCPRMQIFLATKPYY